MANHTRRSRSLHVRGQTALVVAVCVGCALGLVLVTVAWNSGQIQGTLVLCRSTYGCSALDPRSQEVALPIEARANVVWSYGLHEDANFGIYFANWANSSIQWVPQCSSTNASSGACSFVSSGTNYYLTPYYEPLTINQSIAFDLLIFSLTYSGGLP